MLNQSLKSLVKKIAISVDFLIPLDIPETKLLNVRYITGALGNCGIACASMLVEYYAGQIDISEKYWESIKNSDTYLENTGWLHQGLKKIIEIHSNAQIRIFKNKSINFVLRNLAENKPTIVSILVPEPSNLNSESVYSSLNDEIKPERHMVICIGYDKSNIIVHDPRNIGIYGESLKIPKEVFKNIFNGNGIL